MMFLDGAETTVKIALEPSGEGVTQITLNHRNLAERDAAGPCVADFMAARPDDQFRDIAFPME
jgi:hypothetical protein